MKRREDVKLYNILFPLWMLILFPAAWLVILPGNFIIDSLVLLISMAALKIAEKKLWYKKYILKIYAFGMLSDVVGSLFLMLTALVLELGSTGDELYLTIPALLISSGLIFVLNYFVTFRKLEQPTRLKMALIFAIATAPYTFLVPLSWIY